MTVNILGLLLILGKKNYYLTLSMLMDMDFVGVLQQTEKGFFCFNWLRGFIIRNVEYCQIIIFFICQDWHSFFSYFVNVVYHIGGFSNVKLAFLN